MVGGRVRFPRLCSITVFSNVYVQVVFRVLPLATSQVRCSTMYLELWYHLHWAGRSTNLI
jgi:hypothetical protein